MITAVRLNLTRRDLVAAGSVYREALRHELRLVNALDSRSTEVAIRRAQAAASATDTAIRALRRAETAHSAAAVEMGSL